MSLINFEALADVILASFAIVSITSVLTSTVAATSLNLVGLNMALDTGLVVMVKIYRFWASEYMVMCWSLMKYLVVCNLQVVGVPQI